MLMERSDRREEHELRYALAGLSMEAIATFLWLRLRFPDGYFRMSQEEMTEELRRTNIHQIRQYLGELHRRGLIRRNRSDGTYISPFIIRENMRAI